MPLIERLEVLLRTGVHVSLAKAVNWRSPSRAKVPILELTVAGPMTSSAWACVSAYCSWT